MAVLSTTSKSAVVVIMLAVVIVPFFPVATPRGLAERTDDDPNYAYHQCYRGVSPDTEVSYTASVENVLRDMVENTEAGNVYSTWDPISEPLVFGKSACSNADTCNKDLDAARDYLRKNCPHYIGAYAVLGHASLGYSDETY